MLGPSFPLNWAYGVGGEADAAPLRTDADVAVEEVVASLSVLNRAFAVAGHETIFYHISAQCYIEDHKEACEVIFLVLDTRLISILL